MFVAADPHPDGVSVPATLLLLLLMSPEPRLPEAEAEAGPTPTDRGLCPAAAPSIPARESAGLSSEELKSKKNWTVFKSASESSLYFRMT